MTNLRPFDVVTVQRCVLGFNGEAVKVGPVALAANAGAGKLVIATLIEHRFNHEQREFAELTLANGQKVRLRKKPNWPFKGH